MRYDESQTGTRWVHADGVVELDPADVRATVCETCQRAWDDSVSTARTPTPAGRCPFEDEHGTVCAECAEHTDECAHPEHDSRGRCADCCDDCRDTRNVGPGFAIPLDDVPVPDVDADTAVHVIVRLMRKHGFVGTIFTPNDVREQIDEWYYANDDDRTATDDDVSAVMGTWAIEHFEHMLSDHAWEVVNNAIHEVMDARTAKENA